MSSDNLPVECVPSPVECVPSPVESCALINELSQVKAELERVFCDLARVSPEIATYRVWLEKVDAIVYRMHTITRQLLGARHD